MELTPELQIQCVLKALTDTIVPALDPDNAMAQEQAQLCMAMLGFTLERLPKAHRYACTELREFITTGQNLAQVPGLPKTACSALEAVTDAGRELLQSAQVDRAQMYQATADIRSTIGETVDALDANSDVGKAAGRLLVSAAKSQIRRERAWLAPLGIESDPGIPDVDKVLLAPADPATSA